jgi:hypothetical protein
MPGIGSSLTYIPLSINLPDHFQQLKERQASYASTEAWWLCEPEFQRMDSDTAPHELVPKQHSSHSVIFSQASPHLQHELRFAIDTPLIPSAWLSREFPLPKTSDTHPIRCVCLLPFSSSFLTVLQCFCHNTRRTFVFNIFAHLSSRLVVANHLQYPSCLLFASTSYFTGFSSYPTVCCTNTRASRQQSSLAPRCCSCTVHNAPANMEPCLHEECAPICPHY